MSSFTCLTAILFLLIHLPTQGQMMVPYTPAGGFSSPYICDIHLDSKGYLWVLTQESLHRIRNNQQQIYNHRSGLPENPVGIYESADKQIWIYSAGGMVKVVSGGEIKPRSWSPLIAQYASNHLVNSFALDDRREPWLSTVISGELITFRNNAVHVNPVGNEPGPYVVKIGADAYCWGGNSSLREGVKLKFFNGQLKPLILGLTGPGTPTKSVFIQASGGVFVYGRGHELLVFSDTAFIARTFVEQSIETVFEDREGKLWIGLLGGGVRCFPGGYQVLSGAISYLGNRTVNAIAEDASGNLFMGTAGDGIFKLPGKPSMNYREPRIFSTSEVRPGQKSTTTNTLKTEEPVYLHNPVEPAPVNAPPVVFISGMSVGGRDTLFKDHLHLRYDQDLIKINFGATANAGKLRYRYRLWGSDTGWIYSENTSAQYANLAPGNYEFVTEAVNEQGVWSRQPAMVLFTISAPYWTSTSFQSMASGGVILLLGFLIVGRSRQVRKKEREKAATGKKLAELEMQALRSQMNPHFIFNTLAGIQHFINEQQITQANDYLSGFAKLMRAILEHSRKPSVTLAEELELLDQYLKLEVMRSGNRFTYTIHVDPALDTSYERIPPMLIQPHIENAVWHGLMPLSNDGMLTVSFLDREHFMVCEVSDNGIGREKAAINKPASGHRSMGLIITRERMDMLSKTLGGDYRVELNDLMPGDENPGTRVTISLPKLN